MQSYNSFSQNFIMKIFGHLGLQADMYSLGVVFFELWHPFGTAMERHIVLTDLKQKGELPPAWVAEFPEQASLLRRLMFPSPSDRPSATELLQHAFPPRMESELLDGKQLRYLYLLNVSMF
jgi:translation initiation factor 2-alpha kinase 4